MGFLSGGLPQPLYLAAHLVWLVVLGFAAVAAPWSKLRDNEASHVWLGAIVVVSLLWGIAAQVQGLRFHLLGATILTLLFDWPLALVALAVASAAATLALPSGWQAWSLHALVAGALPVASSRAVLRLAERFLPQHLFVYLFVSAFFSGGLAMLASGGAATLLQWAAGARTGADTPAMWLLLAFGEATLTGMILTLAVVYKPHWVATFDDSRYLGRR